MLLIEDRLKRIRLRCNQYIDCYHCKLTKMNCGVIPPCTMLLCHFEQEVFLNEYKLNQYDVDCINMYYNAMFNGRDLTFHPHYCLICKSFPECVSSIHDCSCMFSRCDKFEASDEYKTMNV